MQVFSPTLPVALASLVALASCTTLPPPRIVRRAAAPEPVVDAREEAPAQPVWVSLGARGLPPPITDLAALSNREAVFLASGGVYRWSGLGAPTLVCPIANVRALSIQAEDDRFVAIGGGEYAPTIWRSEDRGAHCETLTLPSLSVQGHHVGALQLTLDRATAIAWSTSGLAARSDDGGALWRLLPRIDNAAVMASGPDGSTLAAVLLSREEPTRVALYQLSRAPDATWTLLSSVGTRRTPMAFQTRSDGSVSAADGVGAFTLARDGAVSARHDFAEYADPNAVPWIIAPAEEGSFFATTLGPLSSLDAQGAHAFGWPAGLRAINPESDDPRARRTLDAASDGTVWVSDSVRVWRGALGGAVEEVTERTLDEPPVAMAARGEILAMATFRAQVAISRDGGAHWQRLAAPAGATPPRAMAIDPHGAVLILTSNALLVSEGAGLTPVALPDRNARISPHPAIGTHGDRWVVIDGEVLTSDDQGAHWTSRFRPQNPPGATAVVSSVIAALDRILVLDQSQSLWQSNDSAMSFTRWSAAPFVRPTPPDALPVRSIPQPLPPVSIAWDGAAEAWLMHPLAISHTTNGGLSFDIDNSAFSPAEFYRAPDGRLFAFARPAESQIAYVSSPCPGGPLGAILMASRNEGYVPIPDFCAHRAAARAFDGDRVYLVDTVGSVTRASLSALGALVDRAP